MTVSIPGNDNGMVIPQDVLVLSRQTHAEAFGSDMACPQLTFTKQD